MIRPIPPHVAIRWIVEVPGVVMVVFFLAYLFGIPMTTLDFLLVCMAADRMAINRMVENGKLDEDWI